MFVSAIFLRVYELFLKVADFSACVSLIAFSFSRFPLRSLLFWGAFSRRKEGGCACAARWVLSGSCLTLLVHCLV